MKQATNLCPNQLRNCYHQTSAWLHFSIESSDGRKIPVLDFSGLHDEDETLEGSHPEVSVSPDSKEKQDLEVFRKNSIKKLVGDAEKLLFQTVSFSTTDDSDGGGHTQSASELSRKVRVL